MEWLKFFDYFGTFVFAISGALRATRHRLDILGLLVLSGVTGVTGGVIRDVILGDVPPVVFRNEFYLILCLLAGVMVFFLSRYIAAHYNIIRYLDAVGLGVFAAIGAAKATAFGLGPVGVILLGTVTAIGGGIVRDVLVREIPSLLLRDLYATAAMAGSAFYYLAHLWQLPMMVQVTGTVFLTTGMRLLAIFFKLQLPRSFRPAEMDNIDL
ncbi:MAG: trimeric intracellular cation channel family protein [Candidatus Cloacimonetes bacterium]|nr:trimeric intracellular cation channel family protein [Candidatus Cloacimonadota bacterium]